jgi:hypothetical protein
MKLYNTKEGIGVYLARGLAGLNDLSKDRRQAGYERREDLNEFCIKGRWWADRAGNLAPLIDEERKGNRSPASLGKCPDVMTSDEMGLFMRGESWGWSMSWGFPPVYARCDVCQQPWTLDNAHDLVTRQDHDEADLSAYVGQALSSITAIPGLENLWHRVSHDTVYNDNYDGESKSGTSGKKWHRVDKDYKILPGDRAMLDVMRFSHKHCNSERTANEARQEMREMFVKAGFPQAQMISIPNEYCPCDKCPPWYTVQVDNLKPIKIGWRKRVITINWMDHQKNLLHLFESEDVTKEHYMIHAWSYAKASEYLAKILPALGAVKVST